MVPKLLPIQTLSRWAITVHLAETYAGEHLQVGHCGVQREGVLQLQREHHVYNSGCTGATNSIWASSG